VQPGAVVAGPAAVGAELVVAHRVGPAAGADPADVWYVGDNHDRDVVCGARAGVGATVLMVSRSTAKTPYTVRQRPDATVDDPHGLLTLLEAT
jgi:FMN phosphatase YigB (HAD superfamily)